MRQAGRGIGWAGRLLLLLTAFMLAPALATASGMVAVDDKIQAKYSGYSLDRVANTFNNLATLTNASAVTVNAPLRLVIVGIASSGPVTLANPSGQTAAGQPYVEIPLPSGQFGPGQTVSAVLKYNNPRRVPFTVTRSVQGVLAPANRPPTANAGAGQTAFVGAAAVLDGSASSDPDGDPITYRWTLAQRPAGSQAALAGPATLHPALAIDKPGRYTAQLIVNDGRLDSAPASVTISTVNSKPVADAGPGQSGRVGDTLALDGSASHDVDGDFLSYRWILPSQPQASGAALQDPNTVGPRLTLDKPGDYTAQLIVNDGQADSAPATVTLSTVNSRPLAKAGQAQAVPLTAPPTPVLLDGTGSRDADADPLSFRWALVAKPAGSQSAPDDPLAPSTRFTPDRAGDYVAQLIVNDGQLDSDPDTVPVTVTAPPPNRPPQITSVPVATATVGQPYRYDVDAADADGDRLSYRLAASAPGLSIDAASGLIQWTPGMGDVGNHPVTVQVDDGQGGSDTQSFGLAVSPPAVPALAGLSRAAAESALRQAGFTVGSLGFQHSDSAADGRVLRQSPAAGAQAAPGAAVDLTVSLGQDTGLPPNPATVAPALDASAATTAAASAPFLYSGANPVQTGMAAGTLEAKRAAIIRGRALDRAGQPLPGVSVSVAGHAEFGQTLTRADGQFDLAVNGGGVLTLDYRKTGHLPAQRQAHVGWQAYVVAEDAVLVVPDAQVAAVTLGAGAPAQRAQGSPVTDADGTRQATVLIPAGTTAVMTLPGGSQQAVGTLHVRATEYTVGGNGPNALPGPLPPTSGYTYAVELSADEAVAAGAKSLDFNQALPVYVDNFLGFPVGEAVPAGWYDSTKAAWIPSDNGRVIQILSVSGGSAQIDADGDGQADSAAQLAALGISAAEQAQLASLYPAGKTLWRVPVRHFTPWDFNWPFGPPADAVSPGPLQTRPGDGKLTCPTNAEGSIIECENQVLGERLPVAGTPYTLNYRSDRAPGRLAARSLDIPLTGAAVPASLERVELEVSVAGRTFAYSLPARPHLAYRFAWDGKDAYGRTLQGAQAVKIRIGFTYPGSYQRTVRFGYNGNGTISGSGKGGPMLGTRQEVTLWRESSATLGGVDVLGEGLGGWTLDVHHRYDPAARVLYLGDGSRRDATSTGGVLELIAGGGADSGSNGIDAASAGLADPIGHVVSAPDGSLYLLDNIINGVGRLRRVGTDGKITTVAPPPYSWPGAADDLAAGPDGRLYVADDESHRILRLEADNTLTTVMSGMTRPWGVAVGPDGAVYAADGLGYRIYRRAPDGSVSAIAGTGQAGKTGDGGQASAARIGSPSRLAVAADGSVYFTESGAGIRRVSPQGILSTVSTDPADGIAVDADGNLYYAAAGLVKKLSPGGQATTVAGGGHPASGHGEGGPALQATLTANDSVNVSLAADGRVYLTDRGAKRIYRLAPPLPGFGGGDLAIPSEDGAELYRFDAYGKHLQTLDTRTGAVLHHFGYDAQGRLARVTDLDGDATTLERDAQGNPTAITGPHGQRTTLTADAQGRLESAANPAGETWRMAYDGGGLLTRLEDPQGHASTFAYDEDGRLVEDANADGGRQTLARQGSATDYTASRATRLGRTTTHHVETLADGGVRRTDTQPDGTQSQTLQRPDGSTQATAADGTVVTVVQAPDPRFGMAAPYAKSLSATTGGLTLTASAVRAATLSNPKDPLSARTLTETASVNGRTSTRAYDAATRTSTHTSAAGRKTTAVHDAKGRVIQAQVPGLLPVSYRYDSHGRLASATQGQRQASYAYDAQGRLQSATDPLGRVTQHQYDAAGRPATQTLPDGRQIHTAWDAAGRLASLQPPACPPNTARPAAARRPTPTTSTKPPPASSAPAASRWTSATTAPGGSTH